MLHWTHSTVYIDCPAWSMERNQNKVHILLYHAAHGVFKKLKCGLRHPVQNTQPDHGQRSSEVLTLCEYKCPAQPMKKDQVWSTASYCVQCAHAAWLWRQIKWEWKKILSCQVESNNFAENFSSIYTGASLEATEKKITRVWCTGFHCVQAECPARQMFTPPDWVQNDT